MRSDYDHLHLTALVQVIADVETIHAACDSAHSRKTAADELAPVRHGVRISPESFRVSAQKVDCGLDVGHAIAKAGAVEDGPVLDARYDEA